MMLATDCMKAASSAAEFARLGGICGEHAIAPDMAANYATHAGLETVFNAFRMDLKPAFG